MDQLSHTTESIQPKPRRRMISRERLMECALKEIQKKVDQQSKDELLWTNGLKSDRELAAHQKLVKKALVDLHNTIETFTINIFEKAIL